jgi:carboxyl-terminal processing protease
MKFRKFLIILFSLLIFLSGVSFGFLLREIFNLKFYWQISPLELFNLKLKEKNFDPELFWLVWTTIKNYYVKQPVSEIDLFYGSLKGMVNALNDPYSVFLDPETAKSFESEITGTFEGIGIEIGIKNNQLTIIAPLENTPASKAGLLAGDKILAIDGKSTVDMSVDEAARLIRGKKGTKVKLTIFRKGWSEPKEFEIIRDKITINTVSFKKIDENIVYLKISHFNSNTYNNLRNAVREILKSGQKKIILDLRNNPGGYLEIAVNCASFWLPNTLITYAKDAKGEIKSFYSKNGGEFSNFKTVVLINTGSASGAEILAGALKDYQKAILVGEKTFGKGSVQELINLPHETALKITTAYWYTPKDKQINEIGIEPDIEIKMTEKDYDQNNDPQLAKAIEILK